MDYNISEEEQRGCFIEQWIDSKSSLFCEVPVFCRSVDLVIYDKREGKLTSVEFKTNNWKRAVEQVMGTAISFDYMEICVRKPKTKESQKRILDYCDEIGVGVYFFDVENRTFEHILYPQSTHRIWSAQKKLVIEFLEKGDSYAGCHKDA